MLKTIVPLNIFSMLNRKFKRLWNGNLL